MTRWTHHGGRLAEAQAAFPEAEGPWIDLSTGINPFAWPGVDSIAVDWRALPDEHALAELENAAAAYFGVDPDHLCAVPGTEIGLRMLGSLLSGPAHHATPSYRTHAEIFEGSAAIAVEQLPNMSGIVVLANPNNPDGRVIERSALDYALGRLRDNIGWLVVDEAFADTDPVHSVAAQIHDDAPLVIFRSFGKFFGLAGLRLGFVLGPRTLIAQFRDKLGTWPVSTAAIAIGSAAYRDSAWIAAMRSTVVAKQVELDALLARHGYTASGRCPLFRLIETADAQALFERLAASAILTRPFDYDPRWLRIGLPGSDEALARFDKALADG